MRRCSSECQPIQFCLSWTNALEIFVWYPRSVPKIHSAYTHLYIHASIFVRKVLILAVQLTYKHSRLYRACILRQTTSSSLFNQIKLQLQRTFFSWKNSAVAMEIMFKEYIYHVHVSIAAFALLSSSLPILITMKQSGFLCHCHCHCNKSTHSMMLNFWLWFANSIYFSRCQQIITRQYFNRCSILEEKMKLNEKQRDEHEKKP